MLPASIGNDLASESDRARGTEIQEKDFNVSDINRLTTMKNRQPKFGRRGLATLFVGFSLASGIVHAGSDVQAYKCNEIAGGSYHLMAFNGDGTLFEAAILTNSNGGSTVAVPYMGVDLHGILTHDLH
ncbi:hypothetical protein G3N58_30745 [Paraburkholderia sp. Ac-20342]|uniref:hypothetical protein n=1 Tax=Paraburkholderia sp. Ac-20342 TaxID=2703889 RepID=UPI00198117FD|nr:hypothetical protein [Paraburkholderia sp. Ac-20342]MBN3851173.1 hypothetical protein [Paraburkholderia sp. Ac-20342]